MIRRAINNLLLRGKYIVNMANNLICAESKKSRPFTVIVEGNIGCGKTTFLNYFKKHKNICVLSEPIDLWRDCKGHNLLGHMYSDPKKWSFTFQSYVQLTMLNHHVLPTPCPVKLMERSIYSARYCFVEKMKRDELLSKPSAAVIDEWFQWLTKNTPINVDLIVYLRSSPEVVYRRMMERNRSEEKSVPFEYLESLHQLHEEWLYYKTLHHCPARVLTLDANLDLESIEEEYGKFEPHIWNLGILNSN
ncbi:deoxynucleoside kinase-like isoform X2 [Harmonia axyridis]|uniref:deoxynucleoside kinase-like isoform X2 n=1 Tax=Harmonia axyridis TaxID=115357 RepID=UPI001E2799B6|nr:deoxynucleoside kinase-like isoform X2 [Harmonia axyridis]